MSSFYTRLVLTGFAVIIIITVVVLVYRWIETYVWKQRKVTFFTNFGIYLSIFLLAIAGTLILIAVRQ